jgi:hypothetical protein
MEAVSSKSAARRAFRLSLLPLAATGRERVSKPAADSDDRRRRRRARRVENTLLNPAELIDDGAARRRT